MSDISIKNSEKEGQGVFAARHFQKGEKVLQFFGPIITYDQAASKGQQSGYPIQINVSSYINVQPPELYTNHSCDPNTGLKEPAIIYTLRNIKKDEEITFDYSTSMHEDDWTMRCNCQSKKCRTII